MHSFLNLGTAMSRLKGPVPARQPLRSLLFRTVVRIEYLPLHILQL